jgi:hypothetical protein
MKSHSRQKNPKQDNAHFRGVAKTLLALPAFTPNPQIRSINAGQSSVSKLSGREHLVINSGTGV